MYRLYSISGRPVLAVPDKPRGLSAIGWQRYHPFTRKRSLIRMVMRLAAMTHIDRALCSLADNPLGPESVSKDDFQGFLEYARTKLGAPAAQPVLIWPPQRERGLIYIHLLEPDARPVAFAKMSFDRLNDERLNTEFRMLNLIQNKNLKNCRVPVVHANGRLNGHSYLIMEPLPFNARPIRNAFGSYPGIAVEEIAGTSRVAGFEELESFPWWRQFSEMSKEAGQLHSFKDELRSLIASGPGLPVCQVHGDLGPANLAISGDQLWMFDWEKSTDKGPVLTDRIGFDLAIHAKTARLRPDRARKIFFDRYLKDHSPEIKRDVMAALAFRLTLEKAVTGVFVRNWEHMVN